MNEHVGIMLTEPGSRVQCTYHAQRKSSHVSANLIKKKPVFTNHSEGECPAYCESSLFYLPFSSPLHFCTQAPLNSRTPP